VAIVVTLYDEENHIVGARAVSIAAEVFLAGATAPFEVTFTTFGPVDRYDVQVQGWCQEVVLSEPETNWAVKLI
jgi:hypothetical protein